MSNIRQGIANAPVGEAGVGTRNTQRHGAGRQLIRNSRRCRGRLPLALCLLLTGAATIPGGAAAGWLPLRGEPRFSVRGLDFRTNQRMRRTLEIVAEDERQTDHFDAGFVEDATLVLLQHMTSKGYLRPQVNIRGLTAGGDTLHFTWVLDKPPTLPRPLELRRVRFRMVPGNIYYYDRFTTQDAIHADGDTVMQAGEIGRFFYPAGFLIRTRRMRAFTETRFRQGADNLREALRRQGFRDARIDARIVDQDDQTGAVHTEVRVETGPRYRVRNLIVRVAGVETASVERVMAPWSRIWEQDTAVRLRNEHYRKGYPDARVELETTAGDRTNGEQLIDVTAILQPGVYKEAGAIHFEGRERTLERVMRRRLMIKPGDPLDPLRIERSRQRLAAMGSFERVTVDTRAPESEPEDPPAPDGPAIRDVVFQVTEGKRLEISLLAGYGSYELLRGGLEVEHLNLWGRGHRSRLVLIQSFKSSEADYVYAVPELLVERVSGFSRLVALQRTELDFQRQEVGASAGIGRYFPALNADLSLRYTYELLRSQRFAEAQDIGRTQASVGSLAAHLRYDRRDNPVYPERGGQAHTRVELAAKTLGGQAEYLIWELGGSLHRPIGGGRTWHGGLTHGIVNALGETRDKLPFNRRFFPGGDRSQRGYRHGEAASLSTTGQLIGSEAYLLLQQEIEQAITPALKFLIFCDALQISEALDQYPEGEWLVAIGAGLRYQTIVGPARVEYGYNLHRRDADPRGTLHLSIGFPF